MYLLARDEGRLEGRSPASLGPPAIPVPTDVDATPPAWPTAFARDRRRGRARRHPDQQRRRSTGPAGSSTSATRTSTARSPPTSSARSFTCRAADPAAARGRRRRHRQHLQRVDAAPVPDAVACTWRPRRRSRRSATSSPRRSPTTTSGSRPLVQGTAPRRRRRQRPTGPGTRTHGDEALQVWTEAGLHGPGLRPARRPGRRRRRRRPPLHRHPTPQPEARPRPRPQLLTLRGEPRHASERPVPLRRQARRWSSGAPPGWAPRPLTVVRRLGATVTVLDHAPVDDSPAQPRSRSTCATPPTSTRRSSRSTDPCTRSSAPPASPTAPPGSCR